MFSSAGPMNSGGSGFFRATLHALPPMPDGAPKNRLGLAKWTTAPDNPLPARVIVNRLWQSFFGRGIVATPEDFGMQGRVAIASRASRFPRAPLHRLRLELQGTDQAHRHFGHMAAGFDVSGGSTRQRSRQPPPLARAALPA